MDIIKNTFRCINRLWELVAIKLPKHTVFTKHKRYIKQYNDAELSALGMAIPTLVTIAEILKANGVAVEKKVLTSTIGAKDENKGRVIQNAKLEIVLERNDKSPTSADEKSATSADEIAKPVPETKTKQYQMNQRPKLKLLRKGRMQVF
ncbi:uncharacterized protein At2g34160-like [Beta vulgaris subsp. vulgaris]|uniref:uncharacterized protein At2g34160-like n=1 Tax=Beta vulgaris subsp. vulgaris TaxID=3555 RepID=UPI002548666F|nr:uncharacterized protein At2g34160-like [Beta vulgaris subsp. vulgaris]